MFLSLIFVWHVFGSTFGCFSNILLLYTACFKTPKQTKSYATLIINFAITDFTECLMDLFIQLRFIIVPFDVTLIYVFHGLCQYTGLLSCKIG
uniref:G_PROTEIN_RECEP_F1_2 domain-containing protein n=1 Tax=Caenorhabditis tropicalis TaxID=1561998 RepID=A0A1I7UKA2_9PELO